MVVPLDGDGETEGDVLKDGVMLKDGVSSKMGSGMSIDLFVEPD